MECHADRTRKGWHSPQARNRNAQARDVGYSKSYAGVGAFVFDVWSAIRSNIQV
jgi:hypothetical protein